ncbi:hypothetical protein J3Q64DRAFT_1857892 [Phycomyces blakesleeanus]|uniref:PH domain-containing protein n=2 Tax=Phycomyces blakesleeanus TaxID=4837 RepID=A0A167Q7Y3_PHYB8|nr:hypothetical protein PHYBLDRAFT_162315 [Phycomyces blakesleeanus NRRL 1555(-)]OAD79239.1 hypothetical protein PHYBLDRAFT_162315 [Phycomyces blakesleeanus NRRL 1555(-)]|eukprot:XP_018297279.1 hypothetical protein PHYBLDRAFT_162315 [Phycomyces blakesleeanus NRRL 1555(-)]
MSSHNSFSSFYSALPHQPSFRFSLRAKTTPVRETIHGESTLKVPVYFPPRLTSLPSRTKPDQSLSLNSSNTPSKHIGTSSYVPILSLPQRQDDVIMQGILLCVCEMGRHRKKSQDFDELKERQRQGRLEWQELNAKLVSNQIELYQQTDNKIVHRIPLASKHCIAYLTIVSPQDCCWSLEIKPRMSIHQGLGSSTGRYLFMSRKIEQSREWYTAIYRTLGVHSRTPMPLLVQVSVPLCDLKTHFLELKPRNHPIKELGVWFEDEVVWLRKKNQQIPIYCLQSGSFLFLIDLNKALLWNNPYHGHRPRFTRFSLATYLSAGTASIREHLGANSMCSLPNPSDFDRRMSNMLAAFAVFDLSRVQNINIGSHRNIKIHTLNDSLELQASSDHTLREWVIRLQQGSQYSTLSNDRVQRHEIYSDLIWKASMLYVKQGRRSTFKQYLCVLTRHRGLILFDKYRRSSWTSKPKSEPIYRRSPKTVYISNAYVYTSPSCVKDMIRTKARNQKTPPKMFEDGMTEGTHAIQLLFVVYQPPNPKDSWIHQKLSGRRVWVFQAKDKEEKEAWVWALDQAKKL